MKKIVLIISVLICHSTNAQNIDFQDFINLFPPINIPFHTDSFNIEKQTLIAIDTTFEQFLNYPFQRLPFGTFPYCASIGQFKITNETVGLLYYNDSWFGQAGGSYRIILLVYNINGTLLEEKVLSNKGGCNYDYADGLGDYSEITFSEIVTTNAFMVTNIVETYIHTDSLDQIFTKINRDTSYSCFKISQNGIIHLPQGNKITEDRLIDFLSHRFLTQKELAFCQKEEKLRLIRNQIFAEYGYSFKSKDMKVYFLFKSGHVYSILSKIS